MVDFVTQAKLYGVGHTAPTVLVPHAAAKRDAARAIEPFVFSAERKLPHDCRLPSMQDHYAPPDWEASIMAGGVKRTYGGVADMHTKVVEENEDGIKKPDNLLFHGGRTGSGEGELKYPRGVATNAGGDILVADSKNHRVHVFNMCAYYKDKFGKKGKLAGEFNLPTDVAVMTNGRIVVADSKNKRVQVFLEDYSFKYMFFTKFEPVYIAVDDNYNIIVSSINRTIDVYRRQGALKHSFSLPSVGSPLPAPIAEGIVKDQVIVCDVADGYIKIFSYTGKFLRQFEPQSQHEGIYCQPVSVAVNHDVGHILVADGLNHVVSVYTETGAFLQEVLKPADDLGCVQAIAVGPEGHLLATEFCANGVHCVKSFRYRDCKCHRMRPGSSKTASKATTPANPIRRPTEKTEADPLYQDKYSFQSVDRAHSPEPEMDEDMKNLRKAMFGEDAPIYKQKNPLIDSA